MNKIQHYVATRFAVKVSFISPSKDTDEDWIRSRTDLLRTYTIPSIAAQKNQDFVWLLFVSQEAPEPPVEKLRHILMKELPAGRAKVLRTPDNSISKGIAQEAHKSGADRIITSRVDSDDALHMDFTRDIRIVAEEYEGRYFVEFHGGFSYDQPSAGLRRYQSLRNPFATLVEPNDANMTSVYCGNHTKLRDFGPMRTLDQSRWMQVVHGANALNTHRGEDIVGDAKKRVMKDFGLGHLG